MDPGDPGPSEDPTDPTEGMGAATKKLTDLRIKNEKKTKGLVQMGMSVIKDIQSGADSQAADSGLPGSRPGSRTGDRPASRTGRGPSPTLGARGPSPTPKTETNDASAAAPPTSKFKGKLQSKKVSRALNMMKAATTVVQKLGYSDVAAHIAGFFTIKKGHTLRAWLKHFDVDHNGTIDFDEWCRGMKELDYKGDIVKPFREMDEDGSGEITIDEIDTEAGDLWLQFRHFCGKHFDSGRDMMQHISQSEGGNGHTCTEQGFTNHLREVGWNKGYEETLFHCLDTHGEGFISTRNMKWLDQEKKKQRRKELAKETAQKSLAVRAQAKILAALALADFKAFLKKRYGHPFKAWRKALDLDGSMSVQRAELFKACHDAGWQGDVRALWRALDKDGSGSTGLEELDPHCAKVLARFKCWAELKFGGKSEDTFLALDRKKAKKLKMPEWVASLRHFGYAGNLKQLFTMIDWQNNHYLTEKDLECFDAWRPPAWLLAEANQSAAEAFKDLLFNKYGHYLKAWRHCLDTDNSNRVSWHEFECAAKKVGFKGDLPGAWLAFDDDLSGFITLKEIDVEAYASLLQFRLWADAEFGGVRSAFKVLDNDGSGELSFREFRRAVRDFGFGSGDSEGADPKTLFNSLDADGAGLIAFNEIAFLDDWEAAIDTSGIDVNGLTASMASTAHTIGEELIEYHTDNPGPGQYEIVSGIGAGPCIPYSKHIGSFSMRKRPAVKNGRGEMIFTRFGFKRIPEKSDTRDMGPDPDYSGPKIKGPAFGWGRTKTKRMPKYFAIKNEEEATPGPGEYDFRSGSTAPMFSITPRRPQSLHPSHRGFAKRAMVPGSLSAF